MLSWLWLQTILTAPLKLGKGVMGRSTRAPLVAERLWQLKEHKRDHCRVRRSSLLKLNCYRDCITETLFRCLDSAMKKVNRYCCPKPSSG